MALNIFSIVVFVACWFKGGHPERFGAGVLLFHGFAEERYRVWRIGDGGFDPVLSPAVAEELAVGRLVVALIFSWLAFRSSRWWPLPVTATLFLIVLVHLLSIMTPIPYNAGASARVGIWFLTYGILLAGVAERWMAGEAPVSWLGRGGAGGRLERPAIQCP